MRVPRFVAATALCGALALSGCGSVTAVWSDPEPPAPATMPPDQDGTADDPPPPRRNSLEISDRTLYFLEGALPSRETDGTTAAVGGALVLRTQCHDGSLTVRLVLPAGPTSVSAVCDGQPHEKPLGDIAAGDPITVTISGKKGTDFAVELAAT